MTSPYVAEFVGTMILLLLGNGVVANNELRQTKGEGTGWLIIGLGWGMAVFVAVFCVGDVSGAHINPAVTIGLAIADKIDWLQVPGYIAAQFAGAAVGTTLVWFLYFDHFQLTKDPDAKLGVFCTAPAVRRPILNLLTEVIATAVLVYGVLHIAEPDTGIGSLKALPVGLLVLAIGLCLGGPTGYAINPARDLGPRIMHQLLPIHDKRDSDWSYSWVPALGPILGGVLAAFCYLGIG